MTVTSIADTNTPGTLRYAIANANDGDTITFDAFLSGQTITLSGTQLEITKSITIDASALSNGIIIDADEKSRVFYIEDETSESITVSMTELTITGANQNGGNGGGICNSENLTLTNCTVSGNTTSGGGGGIYSAGTLTLTNCTVSGNSAVYDGGGICNDFSGTMTLMNCTISGNSAGDGGGIRNIGSGSTVTNCIITKNTTTGSGGGIFNKEYCTLTLTNCIISENSASNGGGIYNLNSCTITLRNCTVTENSAGNGGGILIKADCTLTLYNSIVVGNLALNSGNDIYRDGNNTTINAYNTLSSYTAWNNGSHNPVYDTTLSLFTDADNGDYTLTANSQALDKGNNTYAVDTEGNPLRYDLAGNTRISNRIVDLGTYEYSQQESFSLVVDSLEDIVDSTDGWHTLREAITYAQTGETITFSNSLNGQTITLSGTQLVIDKTLNIDASELSNGIIIDADDKSRVFNITGGSISSPVNLVNLAISGGYTTDSNGGGISNSGTLTLTNCTVSENNVDRYGGGGIANSGTMTLTNCIISENHAADGGGIGNYYGTLTITNCSVSGNSSADGGGGISNYYGTLTMTNCLVSKNSSATASTGGGIDNDYGTLTMTNCTVYGNSSFRGGGIYNYRSSTLMLYNSIVVCNTARDTGNDIDRYNDDSVNAYNTLSSYTEWTDESNNLVYDSTKPLFINAANGDYTLAHNSQVIDEGNNDYAVDADGNPLQYDLAGNVRIFNNIVDLGAYEFSPLVVDSLEDTINATDGKLTLREAIATAQRGKTIIFADNLNGETITLSGTQLAIEKNIIIDASALSNGIIINADGRSRVFFTSNGVGDPPVHLINLTITGGNTQDSGGGIENWGTLILTNCTISGNSANNLGGGIHNANDNRIYNFGDDDMVTLTNCTISGNSASSGGGIYNNFRSLTLTNCTVSSNTASVNGGGIDNNEGPLTLYSSIVTNNQAFEKGCGIANTRGALTMTNCLVSRNSNLEGEYIGSGLMTQTNRNISGSSTFNYGGGIYNTQGWLVLRNCTVSENSASRNGGGIYNDESSHSASAQ